VQLKDLCRRDLAERNTREITKVKTLTTSLLEKRNEEIDRLRAERDTYRTRVADLETAIRGMCMCCKTNNEIAEAALASMPLQRDPVEMPCPLCGAVERDHERSTGT